MTMTNEQINNVKVYFYCPACKKHIAKRNVLQAVHYKAMCPYCYDIRNMVEMRKVGGKMLSLEKFLDEKYGGRNDRTNGIAT